MLLNTAYASISCKAHFKLNIIALFTWKERICNEDSTARGRIKCWIYFLVRYVIINCHCDSTQTTCAVMSAMLASEKNKRQYSAATILKQLHCMCHGFKFFELSCASTICRVEIFETGTCLVFYPKWISGEIPNNIESVSFGFETFQAPM